MPPSGCKCDRPFHSREKGVETGPGVNTYVRDTPLAKRLLNDILGHCPPSKWSGEEPCGPPLARTCANGNDTQMNLLEVGIVTST